MKEKKALSELEKGSPFYHIGALKEEFEAFKRLASARIESLEIKNVSLTKRITKLETNLRDTSNSLDAAIALLPKAKVRKFKGNIEGSLYNDCKDFIQSTLVPISYLPKIPKGNQNLEYKRDVNWVRNILAEQFGDFLKIEKNLSNDKIYRMMKDCGFSRRKFQQVKIVDGVRKATDVILFLAEFKKQDEE